MEVMFVVEPRPHLPRCRDGKLLEIDYAVRSSKPMFKCLRCGELNAKIVIGDYGFGCQKCNILKPISRIVPPKERKARLIRRINEIIEHGRPPRMSRRTYLELHHRLSDLVQQVPDWETTPVRSLLIVLPPLWMRDDQHPELDLDL
jgi:hypothetical protein